MSFGKLSNHFDGIAAKRLSEVETDPAVSNQHELNGVQPLKKILGSQPGRISFKAKFIYLGVEEDDTIVDDGKVTWYDARANHETRSEHRFYYTTNQVIDEAEAEDLLLVARLENGTILFIISAAGSTYENQILWLFGLKEMAGKFKTKRIEEGSDKEIGYAEQIILSEIGIETTEKDSATLLELVLEEFGEEFPTTREFSQFARQTVPEVSSLEDPDLALIKWLEREEHLFRSLEKHLVTDRLKKGFNEDVDEFISFSLSVHNRRKSRAGIAFENHLEQVFIEHNIQYSRGATTEGRKKPDFLFPGIEHYSKDAFPTDKLRMLGVKSTCKDRWRQVLTEAAKIDKKHLLTLEPGISEYQTDEMKSESLQLVIPSPITETYSTDQQSWLIDIDDFLSTVKRIQNSLS